MGSEMCIRDSAPQRRGSHTGACAAGALLLERLFGRVVNLLAVLLGCLLYTSDAADERSSVDLGGRRIIKKKIEIDTGDRREKQSKH